MPKTQAAPGAQQIASREFLEEILVDWRCKDIKAIEAKAEAKAKVQNAEICARLVSAEYRARNALRDAADKIVSMGCQP